MLMELDGETVTVDDAVVVMEIDDEDESDEVTKIDDDNGRLSLVVEGTVTVLLMDSDVLSD